jgi:hypothetical protein
VPEIWSPELWHPDSKTGKLKKHRLENEEKPSKKEPMTIITEAEQSTCSLPLSTLLPVEEEQSGNENEESQIIFS